jgi:hypothetical protein
MAGIRGSTRANVSSGGISRCVPVRKALYASSSISTLSVVRFAPEELKIAQAMEVSDDI